jgi:hypothetical protein
LEQAVAAWLRGQISRIEQQLADSARPSFEKRVESAKSAEIRKVC